MPNIVTISREFGSGGREVGKRLADELGYAYYDREILTALAVETGMDEDYVSHKLDQGSFRGYPVTFARTFSQIPSICNTTVHLLSAQHKLIKELATKGDCVIVGRAADSILAAYNPVNIFVYADPASKLARCKSRETDDEHLTDKELMKQMKQIDKARAEHHDLVSSRPWGDKAGYHLCINTTGFEIKELVPVVSEFCKKWFRKDKQEGICDKTIT